MDPMAHTRRLLGGLAMMAALATPSGPGGQARAEERPADLVLRGGRLLTVDAQDHVAEALAARDGRIVYVGRDAGVARFVGPSTRVIDLKGRTATPGFVDSHLHVLYHGRQSWPGYLDIRFPKVKSKEDLLRVVGERARASRPGAWISANQGFHIAPEDTLAARDLDAVAPANPVYLRHASGQYAVANSAALRAAGITRETPDPHGSRIVRDPRTREPTGVLLHYPAENLVGRLAPGYGERTPQDLEEDVLRGQDLCLAAGITSAQDVIVGAWRDVEAYRRVEASGRLRMRVHLLLYVHTEEQARQVATSVKRSWSDHLAFGGWKLAMDGGLAAGTTLLYDRSLSGARTSYPFHEADALRRIVRTLHDTGLQVAVHVGGDRGIDMVLDAFEEAQAASPRPDPRHRLEHALFPTSKALERIRRLGIVVSTQPQWISWHADGYRLATNDATMARFLPLRTMLSLGIPLAFGCDVPASLDIEPRWAFLGAVGRRTKTGYVPLPEERLTREQVLRVHTMGSAYAAHEEMEKGSLEVGKLADVVVWSGDPTRLKPEEVREWRALVTIVGGKVVHGSP